MDKRKIAIVIAILFVLWLFLRPMYPASGYSFTEGSALTNTVVMDLPNLYIGYGHIVEDTAVVDSEGKTYSNGRDLYYIDIVSTLPFRWNGGSMAWGSTRELVFFTTPWGYWKMYEDVESGVLEGRG